MAFLQDNLNKDTKLVSYWNWMALWFPVFGVLPLLLSQTEHLWNKPHLQFFPLTIAVLAWVSYSETISGKSLATGWRFVGGLSSLFLSMGTSIVATFLYSPWLAHVAILMSFFGWAIVRFAKASWTRVVAICVLFASTVPLPLNWDQRLIGQLQNWSAKACGMGLDALSIPNFLQGNVIQIKNHTLFVEEACSGVTSLYSLIALALIYSILQRRSLVPSLLLLLVTPLAAINGNILRLLVITLGFEWWDVDLTHGFLHDVVGVSTFVASGIALVCAARIVDLIIAPIPKLKSDKSIFRRAFNVIVGWPSLLGEPDDEREETVAISENDRSRFHDKQIQLSLGGLPLFFLLLFANLCTSIPLTIVFISTVTKNEATSSVGIDESYARRFPTADSLPLELGSGWKRNGYNESTRELRSLIGQYSHTWRFVKGEKAVIISLDFAFRGWHGLEQCYRNSGWTVSNISMAENQSNPWSWVECDMINDLGIKGYLWYSLFDEYGKEYEMNVEGLGIDIRFSRQTIVERLRGDGYKELPMTFQVQIFTESGPALSDEELKEIRDLFVAIREQIRSTSMPAIKAMKGQ